MNDFIGIPFEEKGRSRDGVDCWGLVWLIYKELYDKSLPLYTDLYSDTKDRHIGAVINEQLDDAWLRVDNPQKGDIIILRMRGLPFHVGMVVDDKTMIHAEQDLGSVIENYKGLKWSKRVLGFYRMK